MMTISDLNDAFGMDDRLEFSEQHGLVCADVNLNSARATVFLHGAHLTHWQPHGAKPVLFLSESSDFAPDKAIRGGIPICFPWFAGRSDGHSGPSHGFARIQEWKLVFAALVPGEPEDRMNLTFTLAPSELSRRLGFDYFRAVYEINVGSTLRLKLTIANVGSQSLSYEEALHSYFAVGDVRHVALSGLESAPYLDKTDGMLAKLNPVTALRLSSETDRVYPGNQAAIEIADETNARAIRVAKSGSETTIVWNPWIDLAARLPDLPDDAWSRFVCVETANTAAGAITLAPGASHTMQVEISLENVPPC